MAIIRSYANGFEIIDRTEDIVAIPNEWGLVNSLGIFGAGEGVSQHQILIEKITHTGAVLLDRVRGERNYVNKDSTRALHSFAIPHFPIDDAIFPQDVQGKRAYGSPEREETLDAVRMRKMERLRMSHAQLLETARCKALTTGDVYAPNGTVVNNWYTAFSISRQEIDFDLDTTTTDVIAKCEAVIAHIQDNLFTGEVPREIVGVCSPAFFAKLIAHATVKEAYKYFSASQPVLRERLDASSLDARYRQFLIGGIRFIEYRGTSYDGTAYIPTNDAYFVPLGTRDTFQTFYSPANKFDLVNTIGEEVYMFEYRDPKGEKHEIETEANHIHLLRHPAVVVRGYTG
jgi:hypothetical protein